MGAFDITTSRSHAAPRSRNSDSPPRGRRCGVSPIIRTEVFRRFRPLGSLAGPRDRQKTTRDEQPVLGKGSGLPGTAPWKNQDIAMSGQRGSQGGASSSSGPREASRCHPQGPDPPKKLIYYSPKPWGRARVLVVGLVYNKPSMGGGFCILSVAPGGGI